MYNTLQEFQSSFIFIELMELSDLMNLMKSYQYIGDDWMIGWKMSEYLLMITTCLIYISPVFSIYIIVNMFFLIIFPLLVTCNYLYLILFHTHPGSILTFNEFSHI